MRLACALLLLCAGPLWADAEKYAERAQACLEDDRYCVGVISNECRFQSEDFDSSSQTCWKRELDAWQIVLDRTYSKVLLETFSAPKSVTDAIRAEQEVWTEYTNLRCMLQPLAQPETFGGHGTSCFAAMTASRAFELFRRIGTDWGGV